MPDPALPEHTPFARPFVYLSSWSGLRISRRSSQTLPSHPSSLLAQSWAGGIATPADASLVMQLGAEAVFVGSGIFKSSDPETRAKAIVRATTHFNEPAIVAECSEALGEAMRGIDVAKLDPKELLQTRGW